MDFLSALDIVCAFAHCEIRLQQRVLQSRLDAPILAQRFRQCQSQSDRLVVLLTLHNLACVVLCDGYQRRSIGRHFTTFSHKKLVIVFPSGYHFWYICGRRVGDVITNAGKQFIGVLNQSGSQ